MDYEKDIKNDVIFFVTVGSHAYGTNLPESDEDTGGVALIRNKEYYIGTKRFEQVDSFIDENGNKIDRTIYDYRKVVSLCLDNNPNMLDYLFLPERCIKMIKPAWQIMIDNRDKFISTKCRYTFSGYAYSQLQRIKLHRNYLLNPPKNKPTRELFGLKPESIFPKTSYEEILTLSYQYVKEELQQEFFNRASSIITQEFYILFNEYMERDIASIAVNKFLIGQEKYLGMLSTIHSEFIKDKYIGEAQKELKYFAAMKQWNDYERWKSNRNLKRQALENKCGYDSKHASHAIRLLRMGNEILGSKGILVDRTNIDAKELIDIRLGNINYEKVMTEAEQLQKELQVKYDNSKLPKHPKRKEIENIMMEQIDKEIWGIKHA